MILQRFTTPEQDRDLIIERVESHPRPQVIGSIWLTFNGRLLKTAKTLKGVEKEKERLIRAWVLTEVEINK